MKQNTALSAAETAFNNAIYRVQATPDANLLRRDGLRWVPKTNARFNVPVVTLHILGDMYVPFSMQQIYKAAPMPPAPPASWCSARSAAWPTATSPSTNR